ncbi:MAG TPA: peptidoglycan-binding protein [Gaiellaceae bacterium]|nr:peptidoglycan-binding protein [Gaiellaceae bacterium]
MTTRRTLAGAAVTVALVAVVVVIVESLSGPSSSSAAGIDNGVPTSTTTVERRSLSSQTQVSATLGYADASTIAVPSGTAPPDLRQAEQAAQTAQAALQTAQQALTSDEQALAQAEAQLAADRRKAAIDCRGDAAAESGGGSPGGSGGSSGGGAGACAADSQALTNDGQGLAAATTKVGADRHAVSSAASGLQSANTALASARSTAAAYGQTSVYTMLPPVGRVVRRGQALYGVGGAPVALLYGGTTAWRAFVAGMSPGPDVGELNANLRALGYDAPRGDEFTAQTAAAVRAFQTARSTTATGELLLGSVVFEPGPIRVTSVTPTAGAPVQAGPVLAITSTRRVVTIALDASQQTSIKVGDPVTITLPDNSTTPGHVSVVGTVATTPSSNDQGGGAPSTPTIEVDVKPDHPAATGRLDQAPVDVSITTGTVENVLVVPVNALVALSGGGYAVEVVGAGGARSLVAVETGLFDDADGLVQVSGSGLAAGARVVVPSS